MAVAEKLQAADFKTAFRGIPDQFAILFDRVFGEKHFSWRCFWRSAVASTISVGIVGVFLFVLMGAPRLGLPPEVPVFFLFATLLTATPLGGLIYNLIPDYISLLETRWAIKLMARSGRRIPILMMDIVLSSIIYVGWITVLLILVSAIPGANPGGFDRLLVRAQQGFGFFFGGEPDPDIAFQVFGVTVYFLSTFFTSVWLWIYAASVLVSRVLVRMSGGVGFLLKVTDVEKQPFRSMGFTSVVLVSLLFLVGLPFVLLA
jgi:hypothetical protein